MNKDKKIMLLYGGISAEREISIITSKEISKSLKNMGYNIVEIDANENLLADLELHKPDIVFNGLHGTWGEDGSVQEILEKYGVPYTHSGIESSKLAMDKYKSAELFIENGFNHPLTKLMKIEEVKDQNIFDFPYVLKPRNEGSSVGVSIIRNHEELNKYLSENKFRNELLLQQFIEGPEINVAVIGTNKTGSIEIDPKNEFYDYESKYFDAGKTKHIIPPRLESDLIKKVERLGLDAHKLLGCKGISRTEFILDKVTKKFYILELNTQPGMTPTSLVPEIANYKGINFDNLINWILLDATQN